MTNQNIKQVVLDHIDNIELTEHTPLRTNTHSILYLKSGLIKLYKDMRMIESHYYHLLYPDASEELIEILKTASWKLDTRYSEVHSHAMNLFHWYAINLTNYAKCIGLLLFSEST